MTTLHLRRLGADGVVPSHDFRNDVGDLLLMLIYQHSELTDREVIRGPFYLMIISWSRWQNAARYPGIAAAVRVPEMQLCRDDKASLNYAKQRLMVLEQDPSDLELLICRKKGDRLADSYFVNCKTSDAQHSPIQRGY